ncbi:TniQ family protein [Streptomyces sp. NPDC096097]|uniref:TniQ family protein n=1 Tax=Streptomyces sp. NPDC096097 TaxID=3155546 RepID=UPI0033253243
MVTPFHDETVASFIHRIAAANHVSDKDLRELLGVRMLKRTPITALIEPLSIVTGFNESLLRLALPEFGPEAVSNEPGHFGRPLAQRMRSLERPACRRCVHAAGITGQVNRWTTHEKNVCLRHRLWIGDGCVEADDQIDISILTSTIRAQRHHRNLIPRHGRRQVRDAFSGARSVFISLVENRSADPFGVIAEARLHLRDVGGQPAPPSTALGILFHPQIVTLTGLLANREWVRRARRSGHVGWLAGEVTRRGILVGYRPEKADPLFQWVETHLLHHKFMDFYGYRSYGVFFPEETVRMPPRPRPLAQPSPAMPADAGHSPGPS